MTVHLDTSALVGALSEPGDAFDRLRATISDGHRVRLSTIVLYEWLRGPRTVQELRLQEGLFPRGQIVVFDAPAAATAAKLYSTLSRARGRAADLAIAACALVDDAALWTLNPQDFSDVPDLELLQESAP